MSQYMHLNNMFTSYELLIFSRTSYWAFVSLEKTPFVLWTCHAGEHAVSSPIRNNKSDSPLKAVAPWCHAEDNSWEIRGVAISFVSLARASRCHCGAGDPLVDISTVRQEVRYSCLTQSKWTARSCQRLDVTEQAPTPPCSPQKHHTVPQKTPVLSNL